MSERPLSPRARRASVLAGYALAVIFLIVAVEILLLAIVSLANLIAHLYR